MVKSFQELFGTVIKIVGGGVREVVEVKKGFSFPCEKSFGGCHIFQKLFPELMNLCVLGFKLPLFPYNRGWSSTQ